MAWYTYIAVGGGIFALRRPRPYSRHCEEIIGGITVPTIIYAHGHQWEALWRLVTTRHAASLRPSRNGRIGFKPPYSKRGNAAKGRMGSIFCRGGFPPLQ